jgi:hypothetical protein
VSQPFFPLPRAILALEPDGSSDSHSDHDSADASPPPNPCSSPSNRTTKYLNSSPPLLPAPPALQSSQYPRRHSHPSLLRIPALPAVRLYRSGHFSGESGIIYRTNPAEDGEYGTRRSPVISRCMRQWRSLMNGEPRRKARWWFGRVYRQRGRCRSWRARVLVGYVMRRRRRGTCYLC